MRNRRGASTGEMNRTVLIVTPYFAPQNHAAVFRAYKLAKYLPRFGWTPVVLTTGTNYLYNEDPELSAALPREVEVVRTSYIEPSLRGLRMALGGKDRSFLAMHARASQQAGAADSAGDRQPPHQYPSSWARHLYQTVNERWLQVPDAYWTWRPGALREGLRLIRERRIPLVFTTCPPDTCNLIGMALQKPAGRWVADLRDTVGYEARLCPKNTSARNNQSRVTEATLRRADAVTATSSSYELIYNDLYPGIVDGKVHFIPTGLDEELLGPDNGVASGRPPYIVYAGEFLPEYSRLFFEVFAAAVKNDRLRDMRLTLLIVGDLSVNQPRISEKIRGLGLKGHIELIDQLPQREMYCLLRNARAAVLLAGRSSRWTTNYAKMVDYIALRKPVLAMVPDPSEARKWLSRTNLGVFLDGPVEQCASALVDFCLGNIKLPPPNAEECERYTASAQAEAFVKVFEN
ncbi:MAG: hypothetical protein ABSG25_10840, partial [Bryobacteraceae bacterium]